MAQIAQQDDLHIEFTGAFSEMDDATKSFLLAKYRQGIIYDVIVKSSTQGESRILGVKDEYYNGNLIGLSLIFAASTSLVKVRVLGVE